MQLATTNAPLVIVSATTARLVPGCKWQQGDVASLLDGSGQPALVRGANASQPAGHNLATLGHKPLQQTNIAIRNRVDLFGAELAHLFAAKELAASAGTAGRPSAGRAPGPDHRGREEVLVVLMLVRSLRAPCLVFRQTCCFLFTLFAS